MNPTYCVLWELPVLFGGSYSTGSLFGDGINRVRYERQFIVRPLLTFDRTR